MATPTSSTHLGIERDNTSNTGTKLVVKKRIITARRTVYALMGAGLHGLNGVNPKAAIHLIQTYVLPRLLYGLDVITLTTEDMKNLSTYFRKLLRQIQHLPDRTANVASHLLLGRITIESEIHKRILKTFGNIIRNENSIERKLAIRQLATKSLQSGSWFTKTVEIANIYDLPSPYDIIDNPPGKQLLKNLVNKTVGDHCIKQMISEAKSKSTLSRLNYENVKEGKIHNIWKSCGTNPYAITSASLKAKLATGTIYLQYHRAKFSNGHVSPICQLCAEEEEDILHFILKCSKLQYIRDDFLHMISEVLTENLEDQDLIQELITNDEHLCQLVIDCSKFRFLNENAQNRIETLSRVSTWPSRQIWKSDLDRKREKKKARHERNTEFADANETLEEHRANVYAHGEGDVNREYGMSGQRGQRGINTDGFRYNNPHTVSIRPEPYDGGEDWEEYISHFEVCAELGRWRDADKVLALAAALRGPARTFYISLEQTEKRDYGILTQRLGLRFGSTRQQNRWLSRLEMRKRNPGEAIAALADDLRQMAQRAYIDLDARAQEVLALNQLYKSVTPEVKYQCTNQGL
ncbi:Hypothetical predicted protein [Mytilus galloprovincialis]|uniref:Reverse transcriptase zinc-binding domain-containing protein n=1 Tax=Mytilus galloprovincialis TaxID=29158 RepID=A0A8B6FM92_MYTGA|nr:Hypothetical predicted protein [Mytilus galloprovincialis]